MKTIKFMLATVCILVSVTLSAQELPIDILNVKQAKSPIEFIQARNQLERLTLSKPNDWHISYYIAFSDIQLSFMLPSKEEKMRYLTDADNYLKQLSEIKEANQSEVNTLIGLRLYALIASDPQTNGPKYSGEIMMYYEKALKYNANNPRAILLLALFKNDMAKFMHQKYEDLSKELDKAMLLLKQEDKKSPNPTWGEEWISRAQKKN